jgi:ABC-type branched-subunit amino acid transport system substrate-binding protein
MRHTLIRTAALAAAGLLGAGCGGSSSAGKAASSPGSTAATTATVALTAAPVKVMVISDRSGPVANKPMGDGAVAAAKEINASGGIGGRPIDVTLCDTQDNPNVAAGCARQAADGDFVALVAMWTNQEASVLPITDAARLPNIGNYPLTASGFTSPDAFPLDGGSPFEGIGSIRAMQRAGVKKTSFVIPDVAGAGSGTIGLLANVVGKNALGSVVLVPVPTPDLTSYVAAATHGGDGVVGGLGTNEDEAQFVRTFKQSGSSDRLGLLTGDPEGVAKAVGAAGDGAVVASFYKPISVDDAPVKAFVAAMKAAGLQATSQAEEGYASVHLLAQAAKGLPTIDRASLLAALNATTNFDVGLLAPINFTQPEQVIPGLRIFNTRLLAGRIEGGKVVSETQFFNAAVPPA